MKHVDLSDHKPGDSLLKWLPAARINAEERADLLAALNARLKK